MHCAWHIGTDNNKRPRGIYYSTDLEPPAFIMLFRVYVYFTLRVNS